MPLLSTEQQIKLPPRGILIALQDLRDFKTDQYGHHKLALNFHSVLTLGLRLKSESQTNYFRAALQFSLRNLLRR